MTTRTTSATAISAAKKEVESRWYRSRSTREGSAAGRLSISPGASARIRSMGGIRSFSITTAEIIPRIGARVMSERESRGASHQRPSSQDVRKRTAKLPSANQQARVRIGLWSAPAMSRVGRIRNTEGATAAPKKIGGPSASDRAKRCSARTSQDPDRGAAADVVGGHRPALQAIRSRPRTRP